MARGAPSACTPRGPSSGRDTAAVGRANRGRGTSFKGRGWKVEESAAACVASTASPWSRALHLLFPPTFFLHGVTATPPIFLSLSPPPSHKPRLGPTSTGSMVPPSTTPPRLFRAVAVAMVLTSAVAVVAAIPSREQFRTRDECLRSGGGGWRARAPGMVQRFLEHDGCGPPPPPRNPPQLNAAAVAAARAKLTASLASSGITPQALSGGSWQCGHSSGDGKGCGWATAQFLGKVIGKCAECAIAAVGSDSDGDGTNEVTLNPPIWDQPVTIEGDESKCDKCAKEVAKAPKCGGKILGIGSKRKGRSCRLVKAAGCWPKGHEAVIHDCGAGAECKFKVTGAKAKIWCCTPYTKKFFKRWRNNFRCSSLARSKSKDRDGAVVLWE